MQKFHDVDASLAAFQARHERLIFAKLPSQIGLGQPRRFPILNEQINQRPLAGRS